MLLCLLNFPLQSFFIATFVKLKDALSERDCHSLFEEIIEKIADGYKDADYYKILGEFLHNIPGHLDAEQFISTCLQSVQLTITSCHDLSSILQHAPAEDEEKFISSVDAQYHCKVWICEDKWDLAECPIKSCLAGEEKLTKFKEDFEKEIEQLEMHRPLKNHIKKNQEKWDGIFSFEAIHNKGKSKRNRAEEATSSKRNRHNTVNE